MSDRQVSFTERRLGNWSVGVVTMDGELFYAFNPIREVEHGPGGLVIRFEGIEVVNECSACGRFATVPKVAYGWDEAIAKGWLLPKSAISVDWDAGTWVMHESRPR